MTSKLIFCKKCCMDGSAPELTLDEWGICNFCRQAERAEREALVESMNFKKMIDRIKKDGWKNQYNWLTGLMNYVKIRYGKKTKRIPKGT